MKFAAIFAIIVGAGMIVQWLMSYLSQGIPELKTEPLRIAFHLAGEMATALALIISGLGLAFSAPWSPALFLVASGMLLYTAVVSPGYFAQRGQWAWLGIFGILIIVSVLTIIMVA
jgi:hypothetical protein